MYIQYGDREVWGWIEEYVSMLTILAWVLF